MKQITILWNDDWQQFEVPADKTHEPNHEDGTNVYFTQDIGDAVDTARKVHGEEVELKFKLKNLESGEEKECTIDTISSEIAKF